MKTGTVGFVVVHYYNSSAEHGAYQSLDFNQDIKRVARQKSQGNLSMTSWTVYIPSEKGCIPTHVLTFSILHSGNMEYDIPEEDLCCPTLVGQIEAGNFHRAEISS